MRCPLCDVDMQVVPTTRGDCFPQHGDCPAGYAVVELADSDLESRYNAPTELCPHPERWHSQDWDSAETEVTHLVASFVRALRPDVVLETGSAWGQSAYAIGVELAGAGIGVLHTIESAGDRADYTKIRCGSLPVTVHQCSSLDLPLSEIDGQIGFAWFDSLIELRVPEFHHFYPAIANGAIVAFHDTANNDYLWPKIEELEEEGMLLPIRLPTPRGVVFGEVVK